MGKKKKMSKEEVEARMKALNEMKSNPKKMKEVVDSVGATNDVYNEAVKNFRLAYIDNHPFGGEFEVAEVVDTPMGTSIISTTGKNIQIPSDFYKNLKNKAFNDNFKNEQTMLLQMKRKSLGIIKKDFRYFFQFSLSAQNEFSFCFEANIDNKIARRFIEINK